MRYKKTTESCYKKYKYEAWRRGIEFTLTLNTFKALWQLPCFYCGASIETIGIDRLNNAFGYKRDNVAPCCPICNRAKFQMSKESYIAHCKKVFEHCT